MFTAIARRHLALRPAAIGAAVLLALAGCSEAPPPADNGLSAAPAAPATPIVSRAVMTGSEGPSLPACASNSRVKDGGTDVYWAPGETRSVKARLAGGDRVALCEATDDDAWFGVIFPGPGGDMDLCGVGRAITSPREYQGPCRWGWIRGGTVKLSS